MTPVTSCVYLAKSMRDVLSNLRQKHGRSRFLLIVECARHLKCVIFGDLEKKTATSSGYIFDFFSPSLS